MPYPQFQAPGSLSTTQPHMTPPCASTLPIITAEPFWVQHNQPHWSPVQCSRDELGCCHCKGPNIQQMDKADVQSGESKHPRTTCMR